MNEVEKQFLVNLAGVTGVTILISLLFSCKLVLYCRAQGHWIVLPGKYPVNILYILLCCITFVYVVKNFKFICAMVIRDG